jgi:hypothetical protein
MKKKGSGSFCIPRKGVEKLLTTGNRAKWLIPAYLKIAAHTDESGLYSTASHSSIRKALRRNKQDAQGFLQELGKLKLIYTAEQWTKRTGETFPDDVPEKQKIRHILNDFKEDRQDMVWFSRGVVDGIGEFIEPLRRLADCGGEGARMFLYFYSQYDVHTFHACSPNTTIYNKYTPEGKQWATNYMIKEWWDREKFMTLEVLHNVFPEKRSWTELKDPDNWKDMQSHWDAVRNLEAAGFIYQVAAVVSSPIKVTNPHEHTGFDDDGEPLPREWNYTDMEHLAVVHELANLDRFATDTGELQEGIRYVVGQMDEVRSGSVYSVMPTGSNNSVMGLYKPRFIPDNIRNAFVKESIDNRESDRKQASTMLSHFAKTKGLQLREAIVKGEVDSQTTETKGETGEL